MELQILVPLSDSTSADGAVQVLMASTQMQVQSQACWLEQVLVLRLWLDLLQPRLLSMKRSNLPSRYHLNSWRATAWRMVVSLGVFQVCYSSKYKDLQGQVSLKQSFIRGLSGKPHYDYIGWARARQRLLQIQIFNSRQPCSINAFFSFFTPKSATGLVPE